jgi:pimeloyl-ACP methyl ester carboxylesterase
VPPELLEKRIQALEASDMKTYAAQIVGQALAAGSPEELVATLVDSVSRNSKNAYRKVITTGLAGFDLCRSLSQIHVPTLVIGGEHDRVIPPEQAVDLHRRIPGSKYVVIRGVGHLSYFEDPGAFNAALADFLRNLPGA